ncbi:MAG TPA: hypothetical protein VE011_06155 [Candidatus Dormibacteraeota bacterium]|nr:hypothetical protein [Candidatus Dormibacteraeota bacterium]
MIERLRVPSAVLTSSEQALREAGRSGLELFVLWTGIRHGELFEVQSRHVPPQSSYRSQDGCSVRVGSEALYELNVWLYEHGEALGVQIHSHPTDAYHSETDDAFPIVTTEGALSVVVADFGRFGILDQSTAIYRLEDGRWQERPVQIEID